MFRIALALVTAACGGRAVGDEAGDGLSKGSPGGSGTGLPTSPLPPCVPGTPDTEGGWCPWIANDTCYPNRDDACGCECRRTGGTTCSSDFPGDRASVSCF